NDDKCIMCGACTGICPTGALYLRRPKMEVCFDPDKCIVCKLCVRTCPLKAMELSF
ncbi:MAG: 4Fe-4S binding protein, partial [Clostridia bacterium]|nr:4Fe-4S binding protein [Clostridia bacterium]